MASKYDPKGARTIVSNLFQELGGKRSRAKSKIQDLYGDDPDTRDALLAAYNALNAEDFAKKKKKDKLSVASHPKVTP